MNYYEHHLGDYDGATAHLSWLEDCAYRRLLSLYYRTESPIPADIKQACRLVRAVSKPEREAVEQVLREFFDLQDDGWHNTRCDADIATFHDLEPEREAKRENAKERQRRARERRAALFAALRGHDIVPAYDTPTKKLEDLLSRVTGAQPVTAPVTPVTRDDTATHTHTQTHLPPPRVDVSDEANASSSSAEPTLPGFGEEPGKARRPTIPCPYDAIVDAYHRELPSLPRVLLRDGPTWVKRQKAMRSLWGWVLSSRRDDGSRRAETAEEALAWVSAYFRRAASNDFVAGRTPPGRGHENWRADFDYLLTAGGLKQVVEKTPEAA